MSTGLVVSCPYCRRQYTLQTSRAAISPTQRATCGRCGKSFEILARVVVPATKPPPPPPRPRPPAVAPDDARVTSSPAIPKIASAPAQLSPEELDLDELTKEILVSAEELSTPPAPPPLPRPAAPPPVDKQQEPAMKQQEPASTPAPAAPPMVAPTAPRTVEPEPPPVAALLAPAEETPAVAAAPAAPDPTRFLERADPGLAGLIEPKSPSVLALEQLLR